MNRVINFLLPASLLAYTGIAVLERWWVSMLVAPLVAVLLWTGHRRARFSAYVFFSAVAARGLRRGIWPLTLFAIAAILAVQMPAARRAWPRLRWRARRATTPPEAGDKIARP